MVKNLLAMQEMGSIPGSEVPTPVFLLGESHGQRSLAGYSPGGYKELDMIEQLTLSQREMADI